MMFTRKKGEGVAADRTLRDLGVGLPGRKHNIVVLRGSGLKVVGSLMIRREAP
jgi:hypothetical protein